MELKPCPFCGGEPEIITDLSGGFYIHCKNCGCSTFGAMHKELAIEKWNRRQSPSVTEEVREALEFYAWGNHYMTDNGYIEIMDHGERAKKALYSLPREE